MRTSALVVNGIDIRHLTSEIIQDKYPGLRDDPDYLSVEDRFFDYTQACDNQERRNWLIHFIHVGLEKLNRASEMIANRESYNSAIELKREAYIEILAAYTLMGG